MIVFLDFDGVLHPDAAYLVKGRPELRAAGTLFMWAPILEEALVPYPESKIVLSTSWVRVLRSFSRARAFLPVALQARVIGATWHSAMMRHHEGSHRIEVNWFSEMSRYAQIARYLSRAGQRAEHWLAIDDDSEGWPVELRDRLVEPDGALGLGSMATQVELAERLQQTAVQFTSRKSLQCCV
jgi:hypothetical protein